MQDTANPAEIYDARFAPALFNPWGAKMAEIAGLARGEIVLDVACGTGALTRAAAERAGPGGRVVGLDPNPEMLAVARRSGAAIEWVEGRAEAAPFADACFDAVVSQFGMMFFDDKPQALREMARVTKPGGRIAVAVCDAVERSEGYAAFAGLLDRLFGAQVGDAFRAPFVLGDAALLARFCAEAGLNDARVERRESEARFASVADLVSTERACVWTLGGVLDEAQFARLSAAAETELADFVSADGSVVFAMPALVIRWERPV